MPELPEVETTRRGIEPHLLHQAIQQVLIRQPKLRWPVPDNLPEKIQGQTVLNVSRRGKYLALHMSEGGTLLVHLGMSGSLYLVPGDTPPSFHDHLDFVLASGLLLRYTDPRRFGAVLWTDSHWLEHELLCHLGPEPLEGSFTGEYLYERSRNRTQAIKSFIMDSKVVVGVGNIYANEALFMAGIRPDRKAGAISRKRMDRLVETIRQVLAQAIEQGGTTLKDFVGGDGKPGYFKQSLNVYGRADKPCPVCETPLTEIRMGNRSTVFCRQCQS